MAATTPLMLPPEPSPRPPRGSFGTPLGTTNSLNLIRLVLAAAVLVAHSYPLTGRLEEAPPMAGQGLGGWAVAGFFAVSGYLITASRQRTPFGSFLLLRIGRIYPAFLAVLLATAVLFAPIAHLLNHGTLAGYLTTAPSPFSYVYANLFLRIDTYAIGDTLSAVPYPDAWNGSLWTLYYEFLCYLFVGVLLIWRRARTTVWPIAVAFALSVLVFVRVDLALAAVGHDDSIRLLASLLPYFLGGALIRMLKPRLGLHWILGALSLVAIVVAVSVGPSWTAQALAPLYAYGLLWLSTVIPQPRWVAENDVSYGLYIYAFPVQQLLAVLGLWRLDVFWFSVLSLAITAGFAILSWIAIERPALRRTRVSTGRTRDRSAESAPAPAPRQGPPPADPVHV